MIDPKLLTREHFSDTAEKLLKRGYVLDSFICELIERKNYLQKTIQKEREIKNKVAKKVGEIKALEKRIMNLLPLMAEDEVNDENLELLHAASGRLIADADEAAFLFAERVINTISGYYAILQDLINETAKMTDEERDELGIFTKS